MCAVLSVSRPYLLRSTAISVSVPCYMWILYVVDSGISTSSMACQNPLAKLLSRLTVALCGIACSLLSHALHRITLGGKSAGFTLRQKLFLDFSLLSAGFWPYREWASLVPCLVFSTQAHTSLRMSVAQFQPVSTGILHWLASGILWRPCMHCLVLWFSFWAWDDLAQTGAAYSATEKHNANAVVLMVLTFAPHFELDNFLSRLLRVANLIFVLCMCSL